MEIIFSPLTRSQLNGQKWVDSDNILNYQAETREYILMNNPLYDEKSIYIYLASANENVVGRCYYFPTRLKAGNYNITVQSASALFVHKDYRHYAVGADIIAYSTFSENYAQKIFAGISPMALPIYKKLKFINQ